MFRSATFLLVGNGAGMALLLARNLLVARLVSVEDYGIAATFAIIVAMMEAGSQMGLQQLIIQRSDGDDAAVQSGLQTLNLIRSLGSALLFYLIARPFARFLTLEEFAWAFELIALVPIFRGCMHFDVFRLQRHGKFRPFILSFSLSALISVLSVWPFFLLFGDYRAMLFAILVEAASALAISHLLSQRRYRFTLSLGLAKEAVRFGWPLFINAVFLFLVMQGEKVIVARELGLVPLGLFAMGFTLTLTPTLVAARSVQSFFMPKLSAVKHDDARFGDLANVVFQANLISGLLMAFAIALFGPMFIELLLGAKYASLSPLLSFFAVLHALRIFKTGPAVVALARGRSENAMFGNLCRVATLPLAWWVAIEFGDILTIVLVACAGELAGFAVSLVLARARVGVDLRALRRPLLASALFLLVVILLAVDRLESETPELSALSAAVVLTVALAGCLAAMTDLRRYVLQRP